MLENTKSQNCHFQIELEKLCGLSPQVWLCVGPGFSREEVKAAVLTQGKGFVGEAVTTLPELCLRLTQTESSQVFDAPLRREILRLLLNESRIAARMVKLKRLRRRRNVFHRLDLAIQAGRLAFAHADEEKVYEERLLQSVGESPVRLEIQMLAQAYEAWLQASGGLDFPMLLRKAIQVLREGWPGFLEKPEKIGIITVQTRESLEREFWDQIHHHVPTQFFTQNFSLRESAGSSLARLSWQRWHTVDDAAEALAENLNLDDVVIIPDIPSIRRSLKRAFSDRGLPLAEPRDPSQLRWDENLKSALLPLEVVSSQFERNKVLSWLQTFGEGQVGWVTEINQRGIRQGIKAYAPLEDVFRQLTELQTTFGGRKTCVEWSENHLQFLKRYHLRFQTAPWIGEFFVRLWEGIREDLEKVGLVQQKAPPLFWLEKLQNRIYEAPPPVPSLKPRQGIQIHRLQQSPFLTQKRVWILGLPPRWLQGDGVGDDWYTEREREVLASEFAVRSNHQVRDERIQALRGWLQGAEQVVFLDFHYNRDGQERESNQALFKDLSIVFRQDFPVQAEEKGAHPRFLKSYEAIRPVQPQRVQLSPFSSMAHFNPSHRSGRPILAATVLERYSRCSFQALGLHRWKLRDIREPDVELWPDVRGVLLHAAVRVLLKSQDAYGNFSLFPSVALDQVWTAKHTIGLFRSPRIETYIKSRLSRILETFCIQEQAYFKKSGARPISFDDQRFQLDYPQFSVLGQPDRIDDHPEGLFVMDYKTSGSVPHGIEMLERGYRVQLLFYAVAIAKQKARPVVGVQFIELDRFGGRKSGILFKEYNGKEDGKLTHLRANSKSLINLKRDEAWAQSEKWLRIYGEKFVQGYFEAIPNTPRREKECQGCRLADLCGERRRMDSETQFLESSKTSSGELVSKGISGALNSHGNSLHL